MVRNLRSSRGKPSPTTSSISTSISPYFDSEVNNPETNVIEKSGRRRTNPNSNPKNIQPLSESPIEQSKQDSGRIRNGRRKPTLPKSTGTQFKKSKDISTNSPRVIQPNQRSSNNRSTNKPISIKSNKKTQDLSFDLSSSSENEDESDDWKPKSDTDHAGSSDEFESSVSEKSLPLSSDTKVKHIFHRKSQFKSGKVPKTHKTVSKPQKQDSDSDDCDRWEDVDEKAVGEVDVLVAMLRAKQQNEQQMDDSDTPFDGPHSSVSVTIPLGAPKKKAGTMNPEVLARQLHVRQLKELHKSMHIVHVMCFLAHARSLNMRCDRPLYRALGFSLLSDTNTIRDKKGEFIRSDQWTVDHLKHCMNSVLSRVSQDMNKSSDGLLISLLSENILSASGCALFFVAALRVLDFDVRLIVGFDPIPLKPSDKSPVSHSSKSVKKKQNEKSRKENRKIISSSDESIISDNDGFSTKNRIHTFVEVFLSNPGRWICVDLIGRKVDVIPKYSNLPYVIGLCTSLGDNENCQPYMYRSPIDLSTRYDHHWCSTSRVLRLPDEKWSKLLALQQHWCNQDAIIRGTMRSKTSDVITLARDQLDQKQIRLLLLSHPLPKRVQEFKNHPLYILPRNLLKFEVIYPTDAVPVGVFNKEPIYSRECLHLCHTRESWLKEAKVVRPHEKAAKVVKAIMSLKRKLLQGSDPTPPTVEVFGSWQVEDYQPPVAKNGVVPRNEHGTIDLFKPSMLPIGCVHICLTGIHLIAKKLGIDCAPAVTGWKFSGRGWAIPIVHGYAVCREHARTLVDAWRAIRMNAAKMAVTECSERAIGNWRRLVRGLFLWNRVRAQYALAALHNKSKQPTQRKYKTQSNNRKSITTVKTPHIDSSDASASEPENEQLNVIDSTPAPISTELNSLTSTVEVTGGNWKRLGTLEMTGTPIFTLPGIGNRSEVSANRKPTKRPMKKVACRSKSQANRGKKRRKQESSSNEEEGEVITESETESSALTPGTSDSD